MDKIKKYKNIKEAIEANKSFFQVNFLYTEPIKKKANKEASKNAVMINLEKYQTERRFLTYYTKKISRVIK